jgi:hypothetical protein
VFVQPSYTHTHTHTHTQVWTRQLEKAVHVQPSYMELERGISGWLGTSWEPYGVFFFLKFSLKFFFSEKNSQKYCI